MIDQEISSPLVKTAMAWLKSEAPSLPPDLVGAIEKLYEAIEKGYVCISVKPKSAAAWYKTNWVGKEGDYCPFILSEEGQLYLARYFTHESEVASHLINLSKKAISPKNEETVKAALALLFPDNDLADKQRLAALTALYKSLILVSGGPGTGKTTTVVKMLALLQAQSSEPLHILLAAPTGKAAQRLSESIRSAKDKLLVSEDVKNNIPEQAKTLHRLLGAQGDTGRYRHDEKNPLACDVLLIDEASMIDLAMMHAILCALPSHCKLILLGDKDQLDSVEAGSIFGDLCAAQGMSEALSKEFAPYGIEVSTISAKGLLADCRVELTKSYRFSSESRVGRLASASREGDSATFLEELSKKTESRIVPDQLMAYIKAAYAPFQAAAQTGSPEAAFAAFSKFRVLCAHRSGGLSVESIHAQLEPKKEWKVGRPIIIRSNNYGLRLFNGDIGICLANQEGELSVFFETVPGQYRQISPGRLPHYEPAWAMTVHQSQGSEFDNVLFVLPSEITQVLDRSLIYTAITRAKKDVLLCGLDKVIQAALQRLPEPSSGLAGRLGIH